MKTDMKSRLNAFIEKNRHGFLLLYFCIYFPWFHHLERTVTTHFHVIHTALDDMIPFCEYFIVPYLLWFGYVAWAVGYFYLKNKDEYFKLCAMLFTGMTVFLVISTIYPNGHYLRPAYFEHNNIFIQMVKWLYAFSTLSPVWYLPYLCTPLYTQPTGLLSPLQNRCASQDRSNYVFTTISVAGFLFS